MQNIVFWPNSVLIINLPFVSETKVYAQYNRYYNYNVKVKHTRLKTSFFEQCLLKH